MPNVFPHPYQIDESISNFGLLGGIFHFYSNFKRNFQLFKTCVCSGFALFADVPQEDARLVLVTIVRGGSVTFFQN